MKKHIAFSILALFMALGVTSAQDRSTNWFVGAGAGMNIGFDGHKYVSRDLSHIGAGTAADFYVGKFFDDLYGFRAGYQGFGISNQYTNYGKESFHYVHADLLLRAREYFVPYIHAGYANVEKGTPAGGIGVMLPIILSKRISIVPDIKATAMNGKAFPGSDKRLGGNLSGTIGLKVVLGKLKDSKKETSIPAVVPAPVMEQKPAPEPETEPVVEQPVEEPVEEEKPVEEPVVKSWFNMVFFESNSFALSAEAKGILDEAVEFLKQNAGLAVKVDGHADSTGGDELNMALSKKRAKAVAGYLESKGVPADSICCTGYGESSPAAPNNTKEGRARNRRVEIRTSFH